jgi:hypothetical protein
MPGIMKVLVIIIDNNFLVRPICIIIAKGKIIQLL